MQVLNTRLLTDDILSDVFGLSVQVVWKDDRPWVIVRLVIKFLYQRLKTWLTDTKLMYATSCKNLLDCVQYI